MTYLSAFAQAGISGSRKKKREAGEFVDWERALPFEFVEMDVIFIREHKALTAIIYPITSGVL